MNLRRPHATLQSARMPEHQMSHASTKAIDALRCARDARCRVWVLVVRKRTRAVDPPPWIAVGTQVTLRPPHRSVRAQLRHTAPTLGGDGKANARPRVKDLGLREKVIGQPCHPLPRKTVLLTAAPQRAQPEALDMVAEGAERRHVKRHGMVRKIAPNDLRQPTPLLRVTNSPSSPPPTTPAHPQ